MGGFRLLFVAVAGAAALVGIGCAGSTSPREAVETQATREAVGPQTILFSRGGSAMLIESDGSRLRPAAVPHRPLYSPDRQHVLFSLQDQLFVADSGRRRLPDLIAGDGYDCAEGGAWSPDSKSIAYTLGCEDYFISIWTVDRDASNRKELTDTWSRDPVWSPDGRTILFRGKYSLWLADTDGRHQHVLPGFYPPEAARSARWSRDGRRIFLLPDDKLLVMNRNGGGVRVLTPPDLHVTGFALSPDQRLIAVSGATNPDASTCDIFVLPVGGGPAKRLTNARGCDHMPAWSPDGTKIVFESNRDGNSEIYLMNADGSAQTNLTNSPANDTSPVWPAGQSSFAGWGG